MRALLVTDAEVPFSKDFGSHATHFESLKIRTHISYLQALNAVVSFADDERQLVEVAWLDNIILG